MLTWASCQSWPLAASSTSRRHTESGDGRNSGPTQPLDVASHHSASRPTNTRPATPANCQYSSRAVRPRRRRGRRREPPGRGGDDPASPLLRGGIDEARVDQPAGVDRAAQDAGLDRRLLDVEDRLLGEVALELRLVLGQRIELHAGEGGLQLLRLGADRFRDDRLALLDVLP